MWIVYLCIPLGSYLMCFRFLQVAWTFCAAPASCRTTTSRTSKGIETVTPIDINPYGCGTTCIRPTSSAEAEP